MIVGIIQARMGSKRLPGKVLKQINGVPLLKIMLERVALSKKVQRFVVATTTLSADDPIVELCNTVGVDVYRGSETDLLSRYYECAKKYNADVVVRLTADCPLVDPRVIDNVIAIFEAEAVDYASNTVPPETSSFPDGSDVEVFSFDALDIANSKADNPADREHVTFYFWREPFRGFKVVQLRNSIDWSKYRITVDYPEDLEVIKIISSELCADGAVPTLAEIINFIEERPHISKLNRKYYFGQGWNEN